MDRRAALRSAGGIALLGALSGCAGLLTGVQDDTPTGPDADVSTATDDSTATVDHDPPVDGESEDGPDEQLGPDRFPTYWIGAIEGVETDINALEARVSLNGADRVTIVHDGVEIGTFTGDDRRTFHEHSTEPYVRTGEEIEIYGRWDGDRRLLGTRVIEHGYDRR